MKRTDFTILPLGICVLLVLISFVQVLTGDFDFRVEHFIGFPALLIAIFLYIKQRKYYFLFFALTLTVGLLGFLDFYISTYKVGFGPVGINPIFLGLLILFFVLSREQMDNLNPKKVVANEKKEHNIGVIKSFESRFASKTKEELREIINSNGKYSEEAKQAAEKLLQSLKSESD
ncbi:SpoIIIAH-like family protein [Croceivirga thetidis]|uniref:SpoIIIAH-like family protein n=1 Tax=Croceivirga thetidis TaxID=2721623 RepID=A0ABX1GKW0_9FLAO|nr:SpoIIIAH-like family protein [Croceivirga thetidis]NKI30532.1 SpoIIIAH-like family protein [Croceivirga thetidis]